MVEGGMVETERELIVAWMRNSVTKSRKMAESYRGHKTLARCAPDEEAFANIVECFADGIESGLFLKWAAAQKQTTPAQQQP